MKLPTFILCLAMPVLCKGSGVISLERPVNEFITPDIIYYPFDDGILVVNEASVSGHDGQPAAGSFQLPGAVEGRFGSALHFSGGPKEDGNTRNSHVAVQQGDELNFDALSGFTLGVWMRLDAELPVVETQRIIIFDKGGAGYNGADSGGFSFYLQRPAGDEESGRWEMIFETRNGHRSTITKTLPVVLPLADGAWHHLGVSFDHENQSVAFWFDGEQVDLSPQAQTDLLEIAATTRGAAIGERQTNGYWSVFRGDLDDFFITSGIHPFTTPQNKTKP